MGRIVTIALLASIHCLGQPSTIRGINTHYQWKPYTSRTEWNQRKEVLKQRVLTSAGLDPLPVKTPLNPRFVKRTPTELAVVETVLLETLPGFVVGINLYRPLKSSAKMPAVLIPHGHWSDGRVHNADDYSVPALAMNLARQGYVAVAIDMIGYNDTDQHEHKFGGREEDLWSYTPLGLQLWNSIRALDFLQSLPEVDAARIAVTGASGGGTQTFLLSAIDDRVKVAVPVNMISAHMQGGCVCEGAPGLRVDTYNVELAATIAPRPMLMVSCTGDWTKNTPQEEYPLIQKIYELQDAKSRVENAHLDHKHNYNADTRAVVYKFLAKNLQPGLSEADLIERPLTNFKSSDYLAGKQAGRVSGAELFKAWQSMSKAQLQATKNPTELRDRMRRVFHLDTTPARPAQTLRKEGKGSPMLVVYSGSKEGAAEYLKTDRPVIVLSFSGNGDASASHERSYYTYNLSESVLQVQDILRALETIESKEQVEIVPAGGMLLPSLYASAITKKAARLNKDILAKVQEAQDRSFFVPGIERVGGIAAAMKLLGVK